MFRKAIAAIFRKFVRENGKRIGRPSAERPNSSRQKDMRLHAGARRALA